MHDEQTPNDLKQGSAPEVVSTSTVDESSPAMPTTVAKSKMLEPTKLSKTERIVIILLVALPFALVGLGYLFYSKQKDYIGDLQTKITESTTKQNETTQNVQQPQSKTEDQKKLEEYIGSHKVYGLDENKFNRSYGSIFVYESQAPELTLRYDKTENVSEAIRIIQSDGGNDYPLNYVRCPGYSGKPVVTKEQFLQMDVDLSKDICIKLETEGEFIIINRKLEGYGVIDVMSNKQIGNVNLVVSVTVPLKGENTLSQSTKNSIYDLVENLRSNITEIAPEKVQQIEWY